MRLFPQPQSITDRSGFLSAPPPIVSLPTGSALGSRLSALGFQGAPDSIIELSFPNPEAPKSGYTLSITPASIAMAAADESAAFHALATLRQILAQFPEGLPCVEIADWPDLPNRGFMLDISRCKVPTQDSLYELVDLLAALKYNQLQLYTEHTFAYQEHRVVWRDASPLSAADIQALDAYCSERYIELVPNQNSFGHMERWLRHPPYRHLAESPDGFEHPLSGWKTHGSTLKPTHESAAFVDSLFAELLPNFRSRQLNVGGDEPWELGQGYSKSPVAERGKTRVYLDHLLRIQKKVQTRGHRMQFWGDIIINEPELARELPAGVTALLWGYEADHPFAAHCDAMSQAGARFYVVPGTSTWNSIGGRLHNALANIDAASRNAARYGAEGLLLTEWGDNGHHQSHFLSILPILQAASRAWNQTSEPIDLEAAATGTLIPRPLSKSEYAAILQLSETGRCFSQPLHNATWLNRILFTRPEQGGALATQLTLAELRQAATQLESIEAEGELDLARQLLSHAAAKGIALVENRRPPRLSASLVERFRANWLARNRPGGLEESLQALTQANP